jgi:hypothetical protein
MEPKDSLPHSQVLTTCPYLEPNQSSPYPHFLTIHLLSSHLCQDLSSGLLPSGFPTKTLYAPLLSSMLATFPTHVILDLINFE